MVASLNRQLIDDLLDRRYDDAALSVVNSIAGGVTSGRIAQRLSELDNEVVRLLLEGERLKPDNPVLAALLSDLETELTRQARGIRGAAPALQSEAADSAARLTREFALPGIDGTQLASIGLRWNSPDPETVNALLGFVNSPAWDEELSRYPSYIVDTVRNQAIRGIASGWSPTRTAREIRRVTEGLAPHQANNLMRTLFLQSYRRGAAIHQTANADILEEQIRVGVLDQRTCLACIALHGTRLPVGEVVIDHHQGRCFSIAVVKGRPRNIQTGEQWFNALPRSYKENMAAFRRSPGALAALESGNATLQDFVQPYTDSVFGDMVRQGSLRNALGGGSGGPRSPRIPSGGGAPDGQVLTGDGFRQDDGASFSRISDTGTLSDYVNNNGARSQAMWNTGALGFDADANITVDSGVLREYIKKYVRDSRSIYESREYIASMTRDYLQSELGIGVSLAEAEDVINGDEARRAEALLKLAEVSGLRLTEPQTRRLNRAVAGEYLDMQFEEVGDAGTFENARQRAKERSSGIRRDSAEYRRLKEDFDRIMGRGDYLE